MNWRIKAAIFMALCLLPFGSELHYRLQRRITMEWPRSHADLDSLLLAAKRILNAFATRNKGFPETHFLEIGA